MSIWWALQTLALLLVFTAVSADDVVVLTEANFEQEIGKDRSALVEFYAPWFDFQFFFFLDVIFGFWGWCSVVGWVDVHWFVGMEWCWPCLVGDLLLLSSHFWSTLIWSGLWFLSTAWMALRFAIFDLCLEIIWIFMLNFELNSGMLMIFFFFFCFELRTYHFLCNWAMIFESCFRCASFLLIALLFPSFIEMIDTEKTNIKTFISCVVKWS